MKTFKTLLIVQLLLSMTANGQTAENTTIIKSKGMACKLLSNEELNRITPVSVNHENYQNKFMKMIIKEEFKPILKICAAKEFRAFLNMGKESIEELKRADEILPVLKTIRQDIPAFISLLPDTVTEEFVFNDIQRMEIWNYTDKNGVPRSLRVCYYNDQILCIGYL